MEAWSQKWLVIIRTNNTWDQKNYIWALSHFLFCLFGKDRLLSQCLLYRLEWKKNYRHANRLYSDSLYWTGTSLQSRLMQGVFSNANDINLCLMIFPCMSLHSKLVPVQYRESEYAQWWLCICIKVIYYLVCQHTRWQSDDLDWLRKFAKDWQNPIINLKRWDAVPNVLSRMSLWPQNIDHKSNTFVWKEIKR